MTWLKIDDNVPHHKKMLAAGPAAAWLWLCGVAYCQRHKTDGFIPREALPWLGVVKPQPLALVLVRVALWHVEGEGWRVHDFLDWNASSEERQERSGQKAERQQRWRDKKREADASTATHVDASTPRLGDAAPTPPPTPSPSPTPQPAPAPSPGRTTVRDRATVLGIVSPGAWDRQHASHALRGELCGWVCLPQVVHDELVARLTGVNHPDAAAEVRDWALGVRDAYQARGEVVGESSIFTFWRNEWQRTHGSNRPTPPSSLAYADPLAGVREAEAQDRKVHDGR